MPNANKIKTVVVAELREGKAHFRIVDVISEHGLASSAEIRAQVDSYINQGVTEAELFLSSRGGDCFEAEDIAIDLERFGRENVTITVGAVAASACTFLTSTFKTKANPNSQFMFHRPRLGTYGDIDSIEANLVLLRNTQANYIQRYSEKTGKAIEEISEMLSKGDVWMSAKQALEYGFIDEIIESKGVEITAQDRVILEACGAPVIPNVNIENQENTEMDRKVLIATLGLSADATDEQIVAAAEKAKKDSDTLATQQESEADKKKSKAKQLVAKALKEKRISAEMVETYEGLAVDNYDSTQKVLEALTPIPQLTKELGGGVEKTTLEARASWDYSKWMEEDPKGLQALADDSPEEFNRIFNQ